MQNGALSQNTISSLFKKERISNEFRISKKTTKQNNLKIPKVDECPHHCKLGFVDLLFWAQLFKANDVVS